jgi:hypothetical protein
MSTKNATTTAGEYLPGGIKQSELDAWKAKYGSVHQVTVPKDDAGNTVTGYFRKPGIDVLGAAASAANPMQTGEILFENCYLGGDPEIRANDECKLSAMVAVGGIFKVRVASIKEV